MNRQDVIARARAYIEKTSPQLRRVTLGDGDSLFARGILDSMGAIELVGFLESEFGVAVAPEDVTEQNLGTLDDIARFVLSKVTPGGAS